MRPRHSMDRPQMCPEIPRLGPRSDEAVRKTGVESAVPLAYSPGSARGRGSVFVTSSNGVSLSVLTPTFRSGRFLANNLASVRGSGAQHVVMDGGSDDGSVELLDAASDVVWRSEPDDGQSDALNKALVEATGDWIGWLNADEFYLPGVLPW